MKRIPSLDGFRAISILLVIFSHSRLCTVFPARLESIAAQAAVGVTIFFVISGFLITTLLLREYSENNQISLKAFYKRRAFRILPVFFLYMLFVLTIGRLHLNTSELLHTLTFTVNFAFSPPWLIAHFWSLSVEEQFYLFWPATFILFRKHLKSVLGVLIIYSWISRVITYRYPEYSTLILNPYFSVSDPIMIGAFGGILLYQNPSLIKIKIFSSYLFQLAAIAVIALCLYLPTHYKIGIISLPLGNTVISVAILFLIFSYITPSDKIIYKALNSKIMVHIGVLSYSIYIWQQFFMPPRYQLLWLKLPANVLVIYLVSLISYYLWEKPFLRLKNYTGDKRPVAENQLS